jgi:hypothetical protein
MRHLDIIDQATAERALRAAIEQLYRTFARYPLRKRVVGCEHCVFPDDHERLHSKPLRELTGADLEKYSWKAMTTWGYEDDFRHFLPRLFELVAFENSLAAPEVVIGKLAYSGWRDWPVAEQKAVEGYLLALWPYVLTLTPYAAPQAWGPEECLCSVAQVLDDLRPLLDRWQQNTSETALQHLAVLLDSNAGSLIGEPRSLEDGWWSERQSQMQQVIDWLLNPSNAEMLDRAMELGDGLPENFD